MIVKAGSIHLACKFFVIVSVGTARWQRLMEAIEW